MASGNVYGQETLQTPPSRVIEEIRLVSTEEDTDGACTIYSVQAVAGVASAGCAHVGIDYGRRQ